MEKPKPHLFEQVAQNGYTGEILYNRFQVLSSVVHQKKYVIVDHEMPDGIHREGQDEHARREMFDTVADAETRCRDLAVLPVPRWARKRGSLRESLYEELRPMSVSLGAARNELVDREPDKSDPALHAIYTGLINGFGTSQIMTMLYTYYPNTSYKFNFVNWYKNQLHLMGKLKAQKPIASAPDELDDLLGSIPTKSAPSPVEIISAFDDLLSDIPVRRAAKQEVVDDCAKIPNALTGAFDLLSTPKKPAAILKKPRV